MISQVLRYPLSIISDGTGKTPDAGKKCQEHFFLSKKCLVLGYVLSNIYNLLNLMRTDHTTHAQPQKLQFHRKPFPGGIVK